MTEQRLTHLMSEDLLDECGTAGQGGLTVAPLTVPEDITCKPCKQIADHLISNASYGNLTGVEAIRAIATAQEEFEHSFA